MAAEAHWPVLFRAGWMAAGVLALGGLFAGSIQASAQGLTKRASYGSRMSCESAKVLSQSECRNAFENALAELDEKAPRFKTRGECERYFRHCSIAGMGGGGGGVAFAASLKGVEIVVRSGFDRTVLPVVENKHPALSFSPRNVTRQETSRSPQKRVAAQRAWDQHLIAASRPPSMSGGRFDENFPGAVPPLEEPVIPAKPPTPEEIERHKQRLREAPLVR